MTRTTDKQRLAKILEQEKEEKRYDFLSKFTVNKPLIKLANVLNIKISPLELEFIKISHFRRKQLIKKLSKHELTIKDYWRILIYD